MGFAEADIANEDYVGLTRDERQPEQILYLLAIDLFWPAPLERIQGLEHWEAGVVDPALDGAVLTRRGLAFNQLRQIAHVGMLLELRLLVSALHQAGAIVGLHCCGNTRWAALLDLGIDLLSFDVRLSLDAVLDEPRAVRRFLDQGGAFSLGLVPTDLGQEADPLELARAVETSFAATLPDRPDALRQFVTTPACGLAMRSVLEAERIFEQLRAARSGLLRR